MGGRRSGACVGGAAPGGARGAPRGRPGCSSAGGRLGDEGVATGASRVPAGVRMSNSQLPHIWRQTDASISQRRLHAHLAPRATGPGARRSRSPGPVLRERRRVTPVRPSYPAVPKTRSPASPRPGLMKPCSFSPRSSGDGRSGCRALSCDRLDALGRRDQATSRSPRAPTSRSRCSAGRRAAGREHRVRRRTRAESATPSGSARSSRPGAASARCGACRGGRRRRRAPGAGTRRPCRGPARSTGDDHDSPSDAGRRRLQRRATSMSRCGRPRVAS